MQVQPVAQPHQLVLVHLLDLVGGVAALDVGAERPSLDRLAQERRRGTRAEVLGGRLVRGVELAVVVAAARQVDEVLVAEMGDELAQPRVGPEEVLTDVGTGLGAVALELAVEGGVQLVQQHPVLVVDQQLVPLRAEDHLDHVPPGAAEHGFELLDDLAVAAYRAVEALQVAVDDEDQVVEVLPAGERQRAEALGLVAFAVAEERPDPALAGVGHLPVEQVTVVAGLVERGERPQAHADRGKLPELGHQARVRVARQAARGATDLAAEVVEVVGLEAALEERPGVDPGGGVALEVDLVAGPAVVLAAEEVVEADLVQRRRRGVGREVTADAVGRLVRLHDHHRRVPTNERSDAPLDELVAREPRFGFAGNGVDVRGRDGGGEADLCLAGAVEERGEDVPGPRLAVRVDDRVERVEPLLRLFRVGVRKLVDVAVEDHGASLAGDLGTRSTYPPVAFAAPQDLSECRRAPECGAPHRGSSRTRIACPIACGAVPPTTDAIPITVYTDGACSGNPGPGGWAWAVAPDGEPASAGGRSAHDQPADGDPRPCSRPCAH